MPGDNKGPAQGSTQTALSGIPLSSEAVQKLVKDFAALQEEVKKLRGSIGQAESRAVEVTLHNGGEPSAAVRETIARYQALKEELRAPRSPWRYPGRK